MQLNIDFDQAKELEDLDMNRWHTAAKNTLRTEVTSNTRIHLKTSELRLRSWSQQEEVDPLSSMERPHISSQGVKETIKLR